MKKAFPLLLLLLLVTGNAFSQTFNWSRQLSGNSEDWGYSVGVDKARNSYVTGSFLGTVTFPNNCGTFSSFNNTTDIYVAKFDPNGVCLWAKKYGGGGLGGTDEGLSIFVDSAGNSYITGYFTATANFGSQSIVSQGGSDIFIAKHDSNGTLLWVVGCGGPGPDFGYGIAGLVNIYATGYITTSTSGSVAFNSTNGTQCVLSPATSSNDIFVVSYNPSGVCQVAKRAGGPNQDVGSGISLDGGGNAYVTGTFLGMATFGTYTVSGSPLNPNTFIAKFDPALNVQWVKTVTGNARSSSISTDSQGNSYIAGGFMSTATFLGTPSITVNSLGSGDAFVARYDITGGVRWVRTIGATVAGAASGISVRETCDLFVTGSFMGTATFGGSYTPITSAGNRDIFVVRYDTGGVIQWALGAGGGLEDEGRGIIADSFGKASVTGVYKSNIAAFPGAIPNLTNANPITRSIFVAKAAP